MSDLSSRLHQWIERLRAIAQTGLAFDPQVYDRERYEELLKLAAEMAAVNSALQPDAALSDALYEHWRASVGAREKGYVTPKVGVGAIVFNERDELLLIQRTTGHWLFPTGWADVGYLPAQVVIKEVLEETGLRVTPLRLIGVYDSTQLANPNIDNHFWSLSFYCRLDGGTLNRHPSETLDAGFFSRENLPGLLARPGVRWVEHAWAAHRGEMTEVYFDRA
ncbi:MAG: NUDIX hydrolase N-terminal domain-containing protein [Chloroflexi bacterium]|nr:NUDIX hydrolase N-terminal domain-containing protein [Chloroflexota bacterium]